MNDAAKEFIQLCERGDVQAMDLRLPTEPSLVHASGDYGYSALHAAAKFGRLDAMELLLHHGAEINGLDLNERTPLFIAVSKNRLRAVQFLLEHGANLELADNWQGETPLLLIWRFHYDDRPMIDLLLHYNASISARDKRGQNLKERLNPNHDRFKFFQNFERVGKSALIPIRDFKWDEEPPRQVPIDPVELQEYHRQMWLQFHDADSLSWLWHRLIARTNPVPRTEEDLIAMMGPPIEFSYDGDEVTANYFSADGSFNATIGLKGDPPVIESWHAE